MTPEIHRYVERMLVLDNGFVGQPQLFLDYALNEAMLRPEAMEKATQPNPTPKTAPNLSCTLTRTHGYMAIYVTELHPNPNPIIFAFCQPTLDSAARPWPWCACVPYPHPHPHPHQHPHSAARPWPWCACVHSHRTA